MSWTAFLKHILKSPKSSFPNSPFSQNGSPLIRINSSILIPFLLRWENAALYFFKKSKVIAKSNIRTPLRKVDKIRLFQLRKFDQEGNHIFWKFQYFSFPYPYQRSNQLLYRL